MSFHRILSSISMISRIIFDKKFVKPRQWRSKLSLFSGDNFVKTSNLEIMWNHSNWKSLEITLKKNVNLIIDVQLKRFHVKLGKISWNQGKTYVREITLVEIYVKSFQMKITWNQFKEKRESHVDELSMKKFHVKSWGILWNQGNISWH